MTRRESLHLIAGSVLALGAGLLSRLSWERREVDGIKATLTPEMMEGPSYLSLTHLRSDIVDGKPGVPLRLRITLVDLPQRAPLPDAAVDVWHCDAEGNYSGFPKGTEHHRHSPPVALTEGARFLRGLQITDANGVVEFRTVYPGWYDTRDIHVHLKVHVGGSDVPNGYQGGHVCHVGQLFFPDEINAQVAGAPVYAARKDLLTPKEKDRVFLTEQGAQAVMKVTAERVDGKDGYLAEITLGLDPAAQPPPVTGPAAV